MEKPAIGRAEDYLWQRLSDALDISVYSAPAPQSATTPYCVFDITPQPDTQHKQGVSYTRFESTCRVVVEGSSTLADEHLVAIEEAVAFASHDGVSLRRIGPLALPAYYRSGSEYPTYERGLRVKVRVHG